MPLAPVAIITAASKGMGAACARLLAQRGYHRRGVDVISDALPFGWLVVKNRVGVADENGLNLRKALRLSDDQAAISAE